jgi:taurine transport system substrate-binding protein
MAGNSLDVCNLGSSPMVVGFCNGLKISMVYVEKIITDSECLAVRKDSGINSVKDLKGKSIALPFNTSVHFSMLAALKTAGLKATDVKLINMKPDSITATWRRKEIDAAFIWHPILGELVQQDGKVIFTTGDLKPYGTLVFDGIIVRNEFKEKRPDLVLAYLKEYDRMCTQYRDKPEEVAAILSPYLSLAPEKTMEYLKTFLQRAAEGAGDGYVDGPARSEGHRCAQDPARPGRVPQGIRPGQDDPGQLRAVRGFQLPRQDGLRWA